MNIKSLTLSIISVAAVAASLPAQAQEEMQTYKRPAARWDFAPNVWKKETAMLPRGYSAPGPAVNVRAGSVPRNNILGLDPGYMTKPAPRIAPIAQTTIAATPSWTTAVPKFQMPEAFKAAFGKPISVAPPMVAALPQGLPARPAQPMAAQPAAGRSVSGQLRPSRSSRPRSANRAVNGRLLTPQHPVPQVANYGSLGYQPGAYTPTAGSGLSTHASVAGRIIRR